MKAILKTQNFKWGILLLIINLLAGEVVAQYGTSSGRRSEGKPGNKLIILGSVRDKLTGNALEYATVAIMNSSDSSLVTGVITDVTGSFELQTKTKNVYLKISFLGYEDLFITPEFTGQRTDLGVINVSPKQEVLDAVTISATKSQMVFKLDKKVFNVGTDLSNAGGSAIDVLNNVPSVDVSVEGAISLRGNTNVQILINGKPSVIASGSTNALGSITADMIEKVEVITSPSAKYDAEGTTGILNLVIKKEERRGLNGSVTLNTGYPTNHSAGFSVNRRTEKFNLFSQLGVGSRTFLRNSNSETTYRNEDGIDQQTRFNTSEGSKNEQFVNVLLGTDYHLNKHNMFTLSGRFAYEKEKELSDLEYNLKDLVTNNVEKSYRNETTDGTNPKWEYEFQYAKSFEGNEDRSLNFSATGTYFGKDQYTNYENTDALQNTLLKQKVDNSFYELENIFQLDYTHPFSETSTLEAGAKYRISNIKNDYQMQELIDASWLIKDELSNTFNYDEYLLGAYSTYAFEKGNFGFKAGLRLEHVNLKTFLADENKENSQTYVDPFPSAHFSYKINNGFSMQLGYSRRIHRPHMWSLNPFVMIRDEFSRYSGNPELQPEYTNAFELTGIHTGDKGSLNVAVFHRITNDVMDEYTTMIDGIQWTRPSNIGMSYNTGVEMNTKYEPGRQFTISGDLYWTSSKRKGSYLDQNFDFRSSNYACRLTLKKKLPLEIDTEVRLRYYSGEKNFQYTSKPGYYADLGIRKKLMKGRAIVNLSVKDVFNSRKRISEIDQPSFYSYSEYVRGGRRFMIGFSYGFGKGEAMEFSGHKMF